MLHVFCDIKGAGKTKAMIDSANNKAINSKGNVVYIDDDNGPIFQLDNKIRFISTEEYDLKDMNHFYGFLCGILSQDYDISTVYIDGLFNIIEGKMDNTAHLFYSMEKLSQRYDVDFYLNINAHKDDVPEFIKKYVA
ncbi:hypothetical protein IRP63_10960 [Clostridium botulinum]|uniref:Twitching motility protein PilT n=1 Tax=Clostridium botulinum C/D str. DC5 TaxID=1443128 RepID=A0A0A0I6L4_CLOBO|nr:hypothetical protein [Clostridium botulinum]KEI06667.1 hypothetical protein Z952_03675 [Clostridium botulinum C/D str. BKT75002]KEI09579.1 hypothetical protein Z954_12235 [Clostridium botulinum C/D str. BKT2873]KGM94514.1 hypothetical protein Z956_07385 [Clostridium botulinum D str. CCUG 7971]KGM97074.1 hypothetical protein Z955_12510 [Clostridium botulinum C/D str. DC5]KOC48104.1 hypothetical protein ADU88_09195 [Clostridium botulinum]